uniref:uncharacterized protein LOC120345303 n=1 Tax=Styela clava TaxID=7725 RepID=UPI00193ADD0D|nr:uncharacterized protein LOC120345303 [Styela clava]
MSITCMLDGTWHPDPSTFYCHDVYCEEPESVENAQILGYNYVYYRVIKVDCAPSHLISSENFYDNFATQTELTTISIQCGADGNWIPDPKTLSCTVINCSHPILPRNASITQTYIDTLYGAELTIECDEGFFITERILSANIKCSINGKWVPDPEMFACRPVTCGFVKQPANSLVFGNSTSYGAKVAFHCLKGFRVPSSDNEQEIRNSQFLECSKDGTWTNAKAMRDCERITCDDPGYLPASTKHPSTSNSVYDYKSVVEYTCRSGSWFHRGHTRIRITCSDDSQWFPGIAETLPPCVDVTCLQPPMLPNADASPSFDDKDMYSVSETTVYLCQDRYKFSKPPSHGSYISITCQHDGYWSKLPTETQCEEIDCGFPPKIEFMNYVADKTTIGNSVMYSCIEGYKLSQSVISLNGTHFGAVCSSNGKWTPDPDDYACQVVKCPPPLHSIPNGVRHGDVYEYGYSVTYTCDAGFTFRDPNNYQNTIKSTTVSCMDTGEWDKYIPNLKCATLFCDQPYAPKNSSLSESTFEFGSKVKITCFPGYFMNQHNKSGINEEIIQCTKDQTWQPNPYKLDCSPFDCGIPESIENSEQSYLYTKIGSSAQYQCEHGYVVDLGNGGFIVKWPPVTTFVSKCTIQLAWTPHPSTIKCERVQCSVPIPPARGYISGGHWTNRERNFFFEDESTVTCAHGYVLEGMDSLEDKSKCLVNGKWSNNLTMHTCVDVICPKPPEHPGTIRFWNGLTNYRDKVTYECREGYFIKPGKSSITSQCSYDTTWKPSPTFKCIEIQCANPGILPNSVRIDLSGDGNYSQNSQIEYRCLPGYFIAKEQDAKGAWITNLSPGIDKTSSSIKLTCTNEGKWKPLPVNVHCSEPNTGTNLKDFFEAINEYPSTLERTGRLNHQLTSRGSFYEIPVKSSSKAESVVGSHCGDDEVILIENHGQWLQPSSKDDVNTKLHPIVMEETGETHDLWNIFDNDLDTYWMPIEQPEMEYHYYYWKGWVVDWDLQHEYVIASIQLHTSDNFANDVKMFNVHFSLNGEVWSSVGPFHAFIRSHRAEFFYGFQPVQARYIRLNITVTALMRSPIVTKFGVFGSEIDCVLDSTKTTDTMIIPAFFAVLHLLLFFTFFQAYKSDVKDRWKRYILLVPGGNCDSLKLRTFQLSITTSWKKRNHDVDLLLRIVDSKEDSISPIIWIRHSYDGLLRTGFTDTLAINIPVDINLVEKIDVVCIYKQSNINKSSSQFPIPSGHASENLSKILSELSMTASESPMDKAPSIHYDYIPGTLRQISNIFLSGFDSENHVISINKLVLMDPVNRIKKEWSSVTSGSCNKQAGKYFRHGEPVTFELIDTSSKYLRPESGIQKMLSVILQEYPLAWLFYCGQQVHPVVTNLTRMERLCFVILAVFLSFLVEALQHGLSDSTLYFASDDTMSVLQFVEEYFEISRFLMLSIPVILLIVTSLVGKFLSGKWSRRVEDPISYWQGTKPLYSVWKILLSCMHNMISEKQVMEDEKSEEGMSLGHSASRLHLSSINQKSATTVNSGPVELKQLIHEEIQPVVRAIPNYLSENRSLRQFLYPEPENVSKDELFACSSSVIDQTRQSHLVSTSAQISVPSSISYPESDMMQESEVEEINLEKVTLKPKMSESDFTASTESIYKTEFHVKHHSLSSNLQHEHPFLFPSCGVINRPQSLASDIDSVEVFEKTDDRPNVITHRPYPPDDPFKNNLSNEYKPFHFTLARFILAASIIIFAISVTIYIVSNTTNCSEKTSAQVSVLLLLSLLMNICLVIPICACIIAFSLYLLNKLGIGSCFRNRL